MISEDMLEMLRDIDFASLFTYGIFTVVGVLGLSLVSQKPYARLLAREIREVRISHEQHDHPR